MRKKSFQNHRDEGGGFSDTLAVPTVSGSLRCRPRARLAPYHTLRFGTGLGTMAARSALSLDSLRSLGTPRKAAALARSTEAGSDAAGGYAAPSSSPAGARRNSETVVTWSSKPLPSSRSDFFRILLDAVLRFRGRPEPRL